MTMLPFVTNLWAHWPCCVFPGTLVPYLGSNLILGKEEKELLFIIYTHAVPDTVLGIL